jgi:hypothetical protein
VVRIAPMAGEGVVLIKGGGWIFKGPNVFTYSLPQRTTNFTNVKFVIFTIDLIDHPLSLATANAVIRTQ